MTRGQKRSLMRRSHRWLGAVASLLLLVVAGSGILLQHPDWLGAVNNDPLALAVDPADPGRLLRGTHWGVEVSEDGGLHWRELSMLVPPTDVRRILFVGGVADAGLVYAMGAQALVVSTDGGRVWREEPGPADPSVIAAEFLDLTVSPTGELALLTSAGLYRQMRGGTWNIVGEPPVSERNWQQWVHDLHTGHMFGSLGRRTAEGGAWALVLLVLTGLVLHRRAGKKEINTVVQLALIVVLVLSVLVFSAVAAEPPSHEQVRQVMGTMATVQVWADDEAVAQAAADTAFAEFAKIDSLMSTWRADSPLSRLNTARAGTWVTVGTEVCQVLSAAIATSGQTGGAFDPTVLPLVRLWGFRGGRAAVPDSQVLAATLAAVAVQAVEIAGDRARLLLPGMALDLGGIAKGHALDRAAAAMLRLGVAGGVLDLGGNLLVFGSGPGHEVGIVDPEYPDVLALTIPMRERSVATSGQYERFVTIDGQAYGHILDPRTGWPVPVGISATVIASQAIRADALATAVVVLGADAGLSLLESMPGVEGVVITAGGIRLTSGLRTKTAAVELPE